MSRGRQAQTVKLSKEDRKSLESLIRRGTAEQRQVVRAKIALMCHAGASTTAIRKRWAFPRRPSLIGALDWPSKASGFGRGGAHWAAPTYQPRLQLLSLACEPAQVHGRSTPTLDELVERAVQRGVVTQISRSHLQRILQAGDLRPHRVRQWLHSPDPQFRQKVNEICALYRQAPKGSVVLSVDEKTGIQAIERKHADHAPGPGRVRRRGSSSTSAMAPSPSSLHWTCTAGA